jgi:hypothetical protein
MHHFFALNVMSLTRSAFAAHDLWARFREKFGTFSFILDMD